MTPAEMTWLKCDACGEVYSRTGLSMCSARSLRAPVHEFTQLLVCSGCLGGDNGHADWCPAGALASQSAEILSLRERVRDLRDGAIRRVQTGVSEIRLDLNGIIEERDADIGRLTARVAELEVLLSAAEGNAEAFLDARATAAILDDRVSALEGDRDAAIARARTLTLDTSTTSLEAVCSMADRISELEDTVDLERARYCVSPGCDKECGVCRPYLAAIAEIEARRGASWKGAR